MAAKKKTAKKKSTRKKPTSRGKTKLWKAPKNLLLRLITLPLRFSYNRTRNFSFFLRWILFSVLFGSIMSLILIVCYCGIYIPRASFYDISHVAKMPARSLVYASDGRTELGRLHGDNRYVVKYEDVSPHFVDALLAQEDEEFRNHNGVHFMGLLKIPIYYLKYKKMLGASTITMQLARNSFPLGDGVDRKLLEIAVALRIEHNYEKNEILEHYMNRIFFGHTMHGVEAASRAYFEKPSKHLTLSESATLAGIIRGPNLYNPFKSVERAMRERDRALDRMVSSGFINNTEAEEAKKETLHVTPPHRRRIEQTYVMATVNEDLKNILEKNNIKMGNLRIYTTIDHRLQKASERYMESHLKGIERLSGYRHQTRSQWAATTVSKRKDPKYLQGSIVCVENKTGAVRCIVGGRSAKESSLNRAIEDPHKRKQLGSIVKPFVYLSAFDKGMGNQVKDTPINNWPHNHDGKYYSQVSVNQAIAESRNCAAVHAGLFAEKENVSQTLRAAGFENYELDDSSFFLGAGCGTPWEVASAFTIFPNKGLRFRPHIIREIHDGDGNLVYESGNGNGVYYHRAANAKSTQKVKTALDTVTTKGTARALQGKLNFKEPCGGKTGTSSNGKDAWFAGYTESLTCAVWVGFDTPKKVTESGSGSSLALPIWAKIMKSAKDLDYPMYPRAVPAR